MSISAVCLMLAGLLLLGDFATGAHVAFTLLYLVPIGIGVWCVGVEAGVSLSVLSALGCFAIRAEAHVSSLTLAWNAAGAMSAFAAFSVSANALRRRLDAQTALALSDPLTGLGNLRTLEHALEGPCARGAPIAMICVHADDLRRLNEEHGRARGDALLKRLASALSGVLREGDTAVRLSGSELGVLLPDVDFKEASMTLDRLQMAAARLSAGGQDGEIALRFGAVSFERAPRDDRQILATARRIVPARGQSRVAHEHVQDQP